MIGAAPAAAQDCDPFTQPSFRGEVPTAEQVIGIGLGDRDVTTEESDRFLLAVDAASARVTSTYWIPLAQRQKHRIQAMLNESTYTPVGYAYDIVGWSNPLLFNVDGGSSGAVLSPRATVAAAQAEPAPPALPSRQPAIAVYSMSPQFSRGIESSGWLRWLLDRWGVTYRDVSAEDIAAGGLAGVDVLLVPDGYALKDPNVPSDPYGYKDLEPKGRENLKAWVQAGGRYVGWLDGGVLASALGISGTQYGDGGDAGVSTPGSLFRVRVDGGSPLAAGVGPFAWLLDDARYVLSSGAGASIPLRSPDAACRARPWRAQGEAGATGDEHPYARRLGVALRAARVPVVMYRVP